MTYDIKSGAREISNTTKALGVAVVVGLLLLVVGLVRAAGQQSPAPAAVATAGVSATPVSSPSPSGSPSSSPSATPSATTPPPPPPLNNPGRVQAVASKALAGWGLVQAKDRAVALKPLCVPGIYARLVAHPAVVQPNAAPQVSGSGTTAVVTQTAKDHRTYEVHLVEQGSTWLVSSIRVH